ncbi:hypothetical protein [Methanogenium cariaci]|uniref:hypothetical protein n=1 Tax=Methanogenium cariaci TaxID=2197 RepID=UPI000A6CD8EE|nr:hypothetical protein [Methanogenium cariaci]
MGRRSYHIRSGKSGFVKAIASEEQADIVRFPDAFGDYAVVMDPLDGSSLIQVNLAVGTIVGIYRGGDALQKGEDLAVAMYMLYGPMTVLTITVGGGGIHLCPRFRRHLCAPERECPNTRRNALRKRWHPERMASGAPRFHQPL